MNRQFLLALLMLFCVFCSASCKEIIEHSFGVKPVSVDGLGVLSALSNKQFDEEQLTKLVKAMTKQRGVSEEDARALFAIYERQTSDFLRAAGRSGRYADALSVMDVEDYLALILQHEQLRAAVNQTTQAAITAKVKERASFEFDMTTARVGEDTGNLAGAFVNAYNKAASKTSDERRAVFEKQLANNEINIINGYEQAALQMLENKEAMAEQRQMAEKFLTDLKEYNASFSDVKARILDENGRLISPGQMTGRQRSSVQDIFSAGRSAAGNRLSNRMNIIYDKLMNVTDRQVRN